MLIQNTWTQAIQDNLIQDYLSTDERSLGHTVAYMAITSYTWSHGPWVGHGALVYPVRLDGIDDFHIRFKATEHEKKIAQKLWSETEF